MGKAISGHLARLGLPPVTKVFSSPLLRCVQTATAASLELNKIQSTNLAITIDLDLVEKLGEDWYRSWSFENVSDGTWGGPEGYRCNGREGELRAQATRPVDEIIAYQGADWIDRLSGNELLFDEMCSLVSKSANNDNTPFGYSWGTFEVMERVRERCQQLLEEMHARFRDETILLVSHGCPTTTLFSASQNFVTPQGGWPSCGYTSIFVLSERDSESGVWSAPVVASNEHVATDTNLNDVGLGKQEYKNEEPKSEEPKFSKLSGESSAPRDAESSVWSAPVVASNEHVATDTNLNDVGLGKQE
jgi:broad specificity phosphatase PhoE